ncbi:MAG: ATP-dependent DNA helicase RecG [Magnetovibrionaceae bacterium]
MRPDVLFPLFSPVTSLNGVGAKLAKVLEKLGITRKVDLLWQKPVGLIDRRHSPKLSQAEPGRIATLTLDIVHHRPGPTKRAPYRVAAKDDTGGIELVFFHARSDYLKRILPEGGQAVVSGLVEDYQGRLQMTHPDHIVAPSEAESVRRVEPVYPLTAGLSLKVLSKAIAQALDALPVLPEWQDPGFHQKRAWPTFDEAVRALHHPASEESLNPLDPARSRLAFDELLANQLALGLMRRSLRATSGRALDGDGHLRTKLKGMLPFELTGAQSKSIDEITADMASDKRMLRLLQGDVGSGKTVVALYALLAALEVGCQGAFMAPTEILARQHFATLEAWCDQLGLRLALLTGREKGKKRDALLADLADGTINLIVGTHALFQDDVVFRDLGLAVIDEQHRFGVHQRLTLAAKGKGVDVLVMTATPIPRTLMLTSYGDMDTSRLTDKPPGRQPVDTRAVSADRLDQVIEGLGRQLGRGAQAYWVCPLVSDNEDLDLAAAEERQELLSRQFGEDKVGLIHGQMKGKEKDAVMADFSDGKLRLLVATTVIEVGVDVPNATVMVIEHAERFGLAQLHQLRGRIGRGSGASTCLLVYHPPIGQVARRRIEIMRETEDGFRIAEEDLRLRGAGELLGTRQSGLPEFRVAELGSHDDLLAVARDDAELILNRDPELNSDRGQALRTLLYLFERDAAVRLLRSG